MSHHAESLSLADDASVFNELPNINLRMPDPARINNSHLDDSNPSFLASVSHNLILGPSEIDKLSITNYPAMNKTAESHFFYSALSCVYLSSPHSLPLELLVFNISLVHGAKDTKVTVHKPVTEGSLPHCTITSPFTTWRL